jgi:acetolactate synthase-1/3 small subunit
VASRFLATQSSATSAISFKKHIRQRRYGPVPVLPEPSVEDAVSNILYNTPAPSTAPETRHILNCLVQNEPGVLSRVSGILAARGFNIESLVVANTEVQDLSRMTIVFNGRNVQIEQARRQLEDLVSFFFFFFWLFLIMGESKEIPK